MSNITHINEKMKNYLTIFFLEHPSACSAEETDESVSYFQIQNSNGDALQATRDANSVKRFTQNEFKDSQFWYLSKIPGTEYGFIGSKKKISEKRVLTIKGKLSSYHIIIISSNVLICNL